MKMINTVCKNMYLVCSKLEYGPLKLRHLPLFAINGLGLLIAAVIKILLPETLILSSERIFDYFLVNYIIISPRINFAY
jgi:hypothetical protein